MWTDHHWNDLLNMVMLSLLLIHQLVPKVLVNSSESILTCVTSRQRKAPQVGSTIMALLPSEASFAEQVMWMMGCFSTEHQAPQHRLTLS